MSNVKNRLPALPILRARFTADFENGLLISREDFKGRRGQQKGGRPAGSQNRQNRRYFVGINGKQYALSRVLWKMHTGRDPGALYVDHINGDVADNRISNLRLVTPGENRMNSKTAAKSGFKGIYSYVNAKGENRYRVQVCRVTGTGPVGEKGSRDGRVRKTFSYGTFKTLREAVAKYEQVKKEWGMEAFSRPVAPIVSVSLPALPDDPNDLKPGDCWLNDMINAGTQVSA
jgi:hypothetical protein